LSGRIMGILKKDSESKSGKGKGGHSESERGHDAVTAYRLCRVLDAYTLSLTELFQINANENVSNMKLLRSLHDLRRASFEKFSLGVRRGLDSVSPSALSLSASLSPSLVLKEHLDRLSDIMRIAEGDNEENGDANSLDSVISVFVEPMLSAVARSLSECTASERSVYSLNVICSILETLRAHRKAKASARFETLSLLCATQRESLVVSESTLILRDCGVWTVYSALSVCAGKEKGKGPLSAVQGLDAESVTMAMQSLSAYILSLGVLSMPKVDKIADLEVRAETRNGVAKVVFDAYTALYESLADPSNGYGDTQKILTHSPKQIKQVLQLK